MAKTVQLDFYEPSICQLVFTDSYAEAMRLVGNGYTVYFPSKVTGGMDAPDGVYVLGIGKRSTVNARLLIDGEEQERHIKVNFFESL